MQKITMIRPSDLHAHLRDEPLLGHVLPWSNWASNVLVMPNVPAIQTGPEAIRYLNTMLTYKPKFIPWVTIKITPQTTPEMIHEARRLGVIAGKVYPDGVTHGSENGIHDMREIYPILETMSKVGMVCCIHGEKPGTDPDEAERKFLTVFEELVNRFVDLRIVLEHISTWRAAGAVSSCSENVAATITPHHLLLTKERVFNHDGHIRNPHSFCKPVVKTEKDRLALIEAATSGNPKFFLGTDSAPHLRQTKEGVTPPTAGVFSAPSAIETCLEIFDRVGKTNRLQSFASLSGPRFYGMHPSRDYVTYIKIPWIVPEEITWEEDGVLQSIVPFRAGETISWQIAS